MKNIYAILFVIILFSGCSKHDTSFTGTYELEVTGMKNVSKGELEIVGEPDDYFGKISFISKKQRVYEIGLSYKENDSLHFILPGKGGFLALKKENDHWIGTFKYFGIQAEIQATKIGNPCSELTALVDLKPIGRNIISTDQEESFPSFDAANQLLYFTRERKLYSSKYNGSNWESPVRLSFSQEYSDSAPYIFNNGKSLLFTSNRPYNNSESKKKNLWIVEKTTTSWAVPKPLPSPINIDTIGDYHGAAIDSTHFYFISYNRKGGYGRSDIYSAEKNSLGNFEVMNLGRTINSENSEADVYIAPTKEYLLFASSGRDDSYGADDIYISFKEGNTWSSPQNIGPKVNSFAYEYGAWVDESNGYLYFNSFRRGTSDIYRVKLDELNFFKDN
jgi:hypothetical protein